MFILIFDLILATVLIKFFGFSGGQTFFVLFLIDVIFKEWTRPSGPVFRSKVTGFWDEKGDYQIKDN